MAFQEAVTWTGIDAVLSGAGRLAYPLKDPDPLAYRRDVDGDSYFSNFKVAVIWRTLVRAPLPDAKYVYGGVDRGDGTLGTLHASTISSAAGSGSDLAPGDLRYGTVVDDVTGILAGGGYGPNGYGPGTSTVTRGSHFDALRQLFPVELTGVFEDDLAIEGTHLDAAAERAEGLIEEMCPDTAWRCLEDWERVCGFATDVSDPLGRRCERVERKLRERGGLSRQYFIDLAADRGYTVAIEEMEPFQCGHGVCGDTVAIPDIVFVWRVAIFTAPEELDFVAGEGRSGERLGWYDVQEDLETLIEALKPAHTYVIFVYP